MTKNSPGKVNVFSGLRTNIPVYSLVLELDLVIHEVSLEESLSPLCNWANSHRSGRKFDLTLGGGLG
jgi:hypothetical protein